jgi:hypothetical protein
MRYALLISLLLSSCSAQWHLERACKKQPSLCSDSVVVRVDTFTVRDTFSYTRVDTTSVVDTITIDTGSIRVRIIRDHNVIRTIVTQKPDTTYITVVKTLPPSVVYKEHWFKWWYLLIIFAIFVIIIKWKN